MACFQIPGFAAVLEEARHPELRKHAVVVGAPGARAVVYAANRLARREGVREGMPLGQARRLAHRLRIVQPDPEHYRECHRRILELISGYSPVFEGASAGRYFVDFSGTRRLWGSPPDAAFRLERELAERYGLAARTGVGPGKFISQVAAVHVAAGDLGCVFPGGESVFLERLPVEALPGIGWKTASMLRELNVRYCGQLAALSPSMLEPLLGRRAFRLVRLARGEENSPVIPQRAEVFLRVERTLPREEMDRNLLEASLWDAAEEAGWALRSHNRMPGAVRVRILHGDGVEVSGTRRFPSGLLPLDRVLFKAALSLFRRLFHRRVVVRRLVVEWTFLKTPFRQLPLFPGGDEGLEREKRLQRALDIVRDRYGKNALRWDWRTGGSI